VIGLLAAPYRPMCLAAEQHREAGPGFAAREANVTELMARMGHASARAALIYQHVDPERERETAQALSKTIDAERPLRDVARGRDRRRRVETNFQVGVEGVEPPTSAL
jgi:hypothetical protein